MAKSKKPVKKLGGPFLTAAFFCETTIEDKKDGSLSAIRMIDTITVNLPPSAPPEILSGEQGLPIPIAGLLSFKTGGAPGEHTVRLIMHSPSGKTEKALEQTLQFTPEPHGGANLRMNNVFMVKKGGLFWLHVFLDGKRVTRIPLLISVQRAETPPA
jgi:hypothetical protein